MAPRSVVAAHLPTFNAQMRRVYHVRARHAAPPAAAPATAAAAAAAAGPTGPFPRATAARLAAVFTRSAPKPFTARAARLPYACTEATTAAAVPPRCNILPLASAAGAATAPTSAATGPPCRQQQQQHQRQWRQWRRREFRRDGRRRLRCGAGAQPVRPRHRALPAALEAQPLGRAPRREGGPGG